METKKTFALLAALMMISVAGMCVLIPTDDAKASDEVNADIVFDPVKEVKDNQTALDALKGAITKGSVNIEKKDSTFILTLTNIELTIKAKYAIAFEASEANKAAVKVIINGDCTINQEYPSDKSNGGTDNKSAIGVKSPDDRPLTSFTLTGNGTLNVNFTLAVEKTLFAISSVGCPMNILPENGGQLEINVTGKMAAKNGDNCSTIVAVNGLPTIKDTTINMTAEEGVIMSAVACNDYEDATKTKVQDATIENSKITAAGQLGAVFEISDIKTLTLKNSTVSVDIEGSSDFEPEQQSAFVTAEHDHVIVLDGSTITAKVPFAFCHNVKEPESTSSLAIVVKNGSYLSFDCNYAIDYYKEGKSLVKINIELDISDSELEFVAATSLFRLSAGSSVVEKAGSKHIICLSASDVKGKYVETDTPFDSKNKKAFVGEKYTLLFRDSQTKENIAKERVDLNKAYTFKSITVGEKTYTKFSLNGTEYTVDQTYTMTDKTVPYVTFESSTGVGPTPTTDPAFVSITKSPSSAVKTEKFNVEGKVSNADKVTCSLNGGAETDVALTTDNEFSILVPLKSGENTIVMKAYNTQTGKSVTAETIKVTYDDGTTPIIEDITPSPSAPVESETFTVSGKVLNAVKVTYILNDGTEQEVTVGADGKFSFDVTLESGDNTIVVKVYGADGNVTSKTVNVNYDGGSDPEPTPHGGDGNISIPLLVVFLVIVVGIILIAAWPRD